MNIIYFLVGLIIGFLIGFIIFKNSKPKIIKDKYLRRGLYIKTYSSMGVLSPKEDIEVSFEIGEIESTGDISKVEVIYLIADKSKFNTKEFKEKIIYMVNNSWINSKDYSVTRLCKK